MKLQTPCIHNYLALNHDNKTKCHLNKRRINKSTFCSKKHQNPHIIMVMQLQKKHVKNWHSHKWQFERTKFKLLKLHSYLKSCAHFLDIVMAFTHNKNHIGTLFYNTIHIEIIVCVHISFQSNILIHLVCPSICDTTFCCKSIFYVSAAKPAIGKSIVV
jgi:hypothetical protein